MIEIDLISGFLGSGKTTFIREYAKYHMDKGTRICILENDFGAVNVDMLLLNDLYEQGCGLEMLAGACDKDCHQRRLKTKLIAMRMLGYQRVIIEPSGIYDTEEFFDVLREEPLDEWYHIDNVITLVDAGLTSGLEETENEENALLSKESEYLLLTQILSAGQVVLSKTDLTPIEKQKETVAYLNQILESHQSSLRLHEEELIGKDYHSRFPELEKCGYRTEMTEKLWFENKDVYDSLYYMNHRLSRAELEEKITEIFQNTACGKVDRIKGFMNTLDQGFVQVNYTVKESQIMPIASGQEVIIVIGENLNRELISQIMGKEADTL